MNRMLRVGTTALLAEERRARHAWELFVSGDDTCLDVLRPEVALSWRRAKEAGVDSGIKRIPPPPKKSSIGLCLRASAWFKQAPA